MISLACGLAVLAAGWAGQIPLALSGMLAAGAGALVVYNERLRMRIGARTAELERANQRLRTEVDVRKAAESALEASENRTKDIVATLPVPVLVKDASSRIVLMNRAAEETWGVRFEQVAGTAGAACMSPERMAAVLADDRAVFAAGTVTVNEAQLWNSVSECTVDFETYKKPVFDAHGEPHSLICAYVDITRRKHAEDALQRSFDQLRALTAELELLKEDDRRRIAKVIHDDFGQNLLALKIDVQMLHAHAGRHPRLKRRIAHALGTIDATITAVHAMMDDLHPSTLVLGLPAALEWLVVQFEKRSGIRCTLRVVGHQAPLSDARRTSVIFRIVQEALVHVLSHARATRVDLTLAASAEQLSITIADDGGGIGCGDEAELRMRAIRERVDVFGGELGIECVEAGGTRLSILIPTETGATAA